MPIDVSRANVDIALDFLWLCAGGKVREAYDTHAAGRFRHHNLHFPAGRESLLEAQEASSREHPGTTLDVKHVLAEGEFVAVHSHVKRAPMDPGIAVVHLLRFEDGKIAEFWDVAQAIPDDSPNADGAF